MACLPLYGDHSKGALFPRTLGAVKTRRQKNQGRFDGLLTSAFSKNQRNGKKKNGLPSNRKQLRPCHGRKQLGKREIPDRMGTQRSYG